MKTLTAITILLISMGISSCTSSLGGSVDVPVTMVASSEFVEFTLTPTRPTPSLICTPTPTKENLIDSLASGAYLSFSNYDQIQEGPYSVSLYLVSSDGDFTKKLTSDIERPLALTLDGWKVAYITHSDGNLSIRDLETQRETLIELPVMRERCDGIDWSPDGQQLAIACGDIYVSSSPFKDWKSITKIFSDIDRFNIQMMFPAWSPQGNVIAYGDGSSTAPSGSLEGAAPGGLYFTNTACLLDVTTCKEKTVYYPAPDFAFDSPTWSPDGSYLAYLSGPLIIITSTEKNRSGKILKLPEAFDSILVNAIAWSPDNQSIAFSHNGDIYQISTDGSAYSLLRKEAGKVESWIVIP